MNCGKICSQSSHAALGTFINSSSDIQKAYHSEFPFSPGTKICLQVDNLDQLLDAEKKAKEAGLSFFRVVDSGCKNFYKGNPIITALGIGPVCKSKVKHITERLKLL